jgi:outer membrane protein assembly factor BamD (BamD/ComL family)
MSVAGILSSSLFNYSSDGVQNKKQQFQQEFQQLGQDLQSGNLSAAQTDFTALQPSGSQANSPLSTTGNSLISQDFKQLSQDLQSGNVSAAQQDYAKIQQDFQSQGAGTHAHHHHRGGGGGGGNEISQLLEQLGQDLQSGSLSAAQQAYSTLQQDFPQFAQNTGVGQPSSELASGGVSVNA